MIASLTLPSSPPWVGPYGAPGIIIPSHAVLFTHQPIVQELQWRRVTRTPQGGGTGGAGKRPGAGAPVEREQQQILTRIETTPTGTETITHPTPVTT